jgi:16S rRNA (cytidine1402-2'-O)-methyltransferase
VGVLYVVATPIGNLEDVTLRALRVLGEADLVLAEDTRRTRILLERHGVAAKPISLHAHNEAARVDRVLDALEAGGTVALVSDAGTPLVSDPGARLVAAALEADHVVSPIPGPSAALAAISVAGLASERFSFVGFLPRRAGERGALLASLSTRPETLVFFESPRRLPETLRALQQAFGDRSACVARELTKRHEELARGSLSALAERFAEGTKGEVTIVVAGAPSTPPPDVEAGELDAEIRSGLEAGRSSRELAAELARERGASRRRVYARVIALKRSE